MAEYPILSECTKTTEGFYRHTPCGELLDSKQVSHPVWFKDFGHCAGDGSVHVEIVPYCATCGPEPSSHGKPVYVSAFD